MTKGDEIDKVATELQISEEFKIFSLCNNLNSSIKILEKNYLLLEEHFEKHAKLSVNKGAFMVTQVDHRIELVEYMDELNRLVHNYVASSQSLVDLQREHYRELHEQKNSFPDYQKRVDDEFKNNPLCRFIQDLRNYFLHKGIPPITSQRVLNGLTGEIKSLILLNKEMLLSTTYDWKKEAEIFINSLDRDLCLSDIFKKYHKHVFCFQSWFREEEHKIFRNQFDYVETKKLEIKTLGLTMMFEHINQSKALTKFTLEQNFMRFSEYEDAKNVFETNNSKERGKYIINSLKKTIEIPIEILFLILPLYDLTIKDI